MSKRNRNKTPNMQRRLSMGKGAMLGKGHSGHSKLPPLQQFEAAPELYVGLEPGTKSYMLGQCSVYISPPYLSRGWHLSIAHRSRYPTWDEVAKAWYDGVPDSDKRIACMVLPTKDAYINYHEYCFQVLELQTATDGTIKLVGDV